MILLLLDVNKKQTAISPSVFVFDYDINYEKYLFNRPSKPLPWRASSLAIS